MVRARATFSLFLSCATRLEVMHLRLDLVDMVECLRSDIPIIETAIDEVLGSELLIEVFQIALAAGNILNGVCQHLPPSHTHKCSYFCKLRSHSLHCICDRVALLVMPMESQFLL